MRRFSRIPKHLAKHRFEIASFVELSHTFQYGGCDCTLRNIDDLMELIDFLDLDQLVHDTHKKVK